METCKDCGDIRGTGSFCTECKKVRSQWVSAIQSERLIEVMQRGYRLSEAMYRALGDWDKK